MNELLNAMPEDTKIISIVVIAAFVLLPMIAIIVGRVLRGRADRKEGSSDSR